MIKKVVVCLAALAITTVVAANQETVSRVFRLQHVSVAEASAAVQPMLTEFGSLTLQPKLSRIVVQDQPVVIDRVAAMLEKLDRVPGNYSIQMELLEGGRKVPFGTAQEYRAEERLYTMFKAEAFYRLGSSTVEGVLGGSAQAELGTSYQVSFVAQAPEGSNSSPWGMRKPDEQLHLRQLVLERKGVAADGTVTTFELLRTNVLLSPNQTVYIGAGNSEDSGEVLVLIVHARKFGSR
jgi:hypothetical protein